ncbi:hypothetical protein CEXT_213111 [Caerostris extrusa]|uniref:Uncharacterized protein n=1 Tax=Caerostris extrusa TaxID=172846 RepID=A0AAV4PW89_CAEEX|nr:hypothetical protein CEXT_213111 [Caerostris extrusa]
MVPPPFRTLPTSDERILYTPFTCSNTVKEFFDLEIEVAYTRHRLIRPIKRLIELVYLIRYYQKTEIGFTIALAFASPVPSDYQLLFRLMANGLTRLHFTNLDWFG